MATSCGTSSKLWNGGDVQAPELLNLRTVTTRELQITFNENVTAENENFEFQDELSILSMDILDNIITLQFHTDTVAGTEYSFQATVYDLVGNSVLIVDSFYGINLRIPHIIINEFTCEGSKSNGDKVELAVLSDGNTAGLVLQEGGYYSYSQQIVLPALEVEKGSFIVIHFRPDPQTDLENETQTMYSSTHAQAYDTAWDVFSAHDTGISNSNSSLLLLSHPNGLILDAILYSSKDDDPNHAYRGFASSKPFAGANEIVDKNAWKISNQVVLPSDAVNPDNSTTTRSISRDSLSTDTDHKQDWHITPTRGSSFGEINNDEHYTK